MKRIKALLRRTTSGFTLSMSQRPIVMIILLLVTINLVFLVAASIALVFIGEDYNFPTAFVAAASFLVVPAQLANVDHTPTLVVGTIVVIVGMLLFSGTIIALVTTTLREYLMKKSGARGKLNLSNHIVILRYNCEVPAILVNLMQSCERKTILILSDKTRDEVRADLLASVAALDTKPKGKLRLIVRQGDPNSLCELHEIGISHAAGLLVMAPDGDVDDFGVLKLVMKIASVELLNNPPIGIETTSEEVSAKMSKLNNTIAGLNDKCITYFSHDVKLGKHMANSISGVDVRIIGENKKLPIILQSLKSKPKHYSAAEYRKFSDDLSKTGTDKTVALILSDENYADIDANVFSTLIELSALCGVQNRKFKVVAEILDPNNKSSLEKFNVQDIIISTHIISEFAAKLLTDPDFKY